MRNTVRCHSAYVVLQPIIPGGGGGNTSVESTVWEHGTHDKYWRCVPPKKILTMTTNIKWQYFWLGNWLTTWCPWRITDESPYAILTEHFSLFCLYSLVVCCKIYQDHDSWLSFKFIFLYEQQEKFTNKKQLDSETINISLIFKKCLSTLLPATWFQLNGMISISKTIDFASPADRMQTKIL